jgi:hypothetical protein
MCVDDFVAGQNMTHFAPAGVNIGLSVKEHVWVALTELFLSSRSDSFLYLGVGHNFEVGIVILILE